MPNYWLGVLGTWFFADAVSSLWQYTRPERKNGQDWLRDHSFRILRGLLGIVLIIMGAMG